MTDLTSVAITATAETALKKLKKADIGVYNCKKDGAKFIFSVKDKHLKKVFAIFAKPCYNIGIINKSSRQRLFLRAFNRIGLIVGAFLFVAIAIISNSFIFKISVGGSGSYLSPEIKRIIYQSGAKEFKLYSGFDAPLATGKILALPQVTFCNIEKRGSILYVDVQVNEQSTSVVLRSPLVSDREGTVKNIVAVCGTAQVTLGAKVKKGDQLIAPYTIVGEETAESIAVGYCELECTGRTEFFASEQSDENLKSAYSSVLIDSDKILTRTHTVEPCEGGVTYIIEFTYLHKLSINME